MHVTAAAVATDGTAYSWSRRGGEGAVDAEEEAVEEVGKGEEDEAAFAVAHRAVLAKRPRSVGEVVAVETAAAAAAAASTSAEIAAAAASPRATSRHARTTRAPPSASARAVSNPIPLLPPVTIATCPASGVALDPPLALACTT
jgi:hypothetical protein